MDSAIAPGAEMSESGSGTATRCGGPHAYLSASHELYARREIGRCTFRPYTHTGSNATRYTPETMAQTCTRGNVLASRCTVSCVGDSKSARAGRGAVRPSALKTPIADRRLTTPRVGRGAGSAATAAASSSAEAPTLVIARFFFFNFYV